MTTKEQVEAMLKVVSNRCRNLQKVIQRARALEVAAADGQTLNDEQLESVRGIAKKEALLAELQEIMKKQAALIEPPEPDAPKLSKRAAKAAKAKAKDKDSSKSISEKGSEECDHIDKDIDACTPSEPATDAPIGNGNYVSAKDHHAFTMELEKSAEERDAMAREMAELKLQHQQQLIHCKKETVRNILNLFHITDFLRQAGSREALLSYYESPNAKPSARALSGLHLDLLCYFNIMLTTPNGSVPHHEAVDVSTSHGLEFLRQSVSEAFEGTSYSSLADIVSVISSCPILTERGEDLEDPERSGIGNIVTASLKDSSRVGALGEPGHIVDDPIADENLP